MPNEVLIYGSIHQFSSSDFINAINENDEDNLTVRINTGGGSPEYGFGMIAKFKEFEGEKNIKVDGKAFSMGAYFCVYADHSEALDVSEFMIHRAAYPSWFEKDAEFFTDELRANLDRMNKNLEKALRNKIDVAKFEQMKDVKIKDIFSMDSRIDVFLSATEAKKIGLIDKINKITPVKKAEIASEMVKIAAKYEPETVVTRTIPAENPVAEVIDKPKNNKKMTKEEFKAAHPEAYAEIFNAGVKQESERIGAWMVYNDVDPKAVLAGIDSGDDLGAKSTAEFVRKSAALGTLGKIEEDSTEEVPTEAVKTAEQKAEKNTADFLAEVKNELKAEA